MRGGIPTTRLNLLLSKAAFVPRANIELITKLSWQAAGAKPTSKGIAKGNPQSIMNVSVLLAAVLLLDFILSYIVHWISLDGATMHMGASGEATDPDCAVAEHAY